MTARLRGPGGEETRINFSRAAEPSALDQPLSVNLFCSRPRQQWSFFYTLQGRVAMDTPGLTGQLLMLRKLTTGQSLTGCPLFGSRLASKI